jgi:WD40 repeat protein
LVGYFGLGVFHRIDPTNTDEKDERFIVFNGITLDVYDAESWCRIYRLELGHQRGEEYMTCITQSLRGRYFCWNGFKGVISIWDIETGRIASNVYVEEDRAATYAVLSPDESKVAISVKGTIQVFDTVTGIKMGSYYEGLDSDNIFNIIFEQDHFLTTNRVLSNTNDVFMPNMRSVVRVRDMVVVEDHYVHEDYVVQVPHTGHVPFFLNAQVCRAIVSFATPFLYPKITCELTFSF